MRTARPVARTCPGRRVAGDGGVVHNRRADAVAAARHRRSRWWRQVWCRGPVCLRRRTGGVAGEVIVEPGDHLQLRRRLVTGVEGAEVWGIERAASAITWASGRRCRLRRGRDLPLRRIVSPGGYATRRPNQAAEPGGQTPHQRSCGSCPPVGVGPDHARGWTWVCMRRGGQPPFRTAARFLARAGAITGRIPPPRTGRDRRAEPDLCSPHLVRRWNRHIGRTGRERPRYPHRPGPYAAPAPPATAGRDGGGRCGA